MKGYVQVYTGNGKGKTTAAIGLAVRAAGANLKVFIGQFVKGMHYSELDSLKRFDDLITIKQFGRSCFIYNDPTEEDIRRAREGLAEAKEIINSGKYNVVILDEIHIALYYKLFSVDEVVDIIKNKPEDVELILTGRYAPQQIIDLADLVTEMREIKHYYEKGVMARDGIEK
ncbi:cob(I)yrinic acid a,c-diamide adenosyltransferase [Desulfothermus okinawensis JCM 13304]